MSSRRWVAVIAIGFAAFAYLSQYGQWMVPVPTVDVTPGLARYFANPLFQLVVACVGTALAMRQLSIASSAGFLNRHAWLIVGLTLVLATIGPLLVARFVLNAFPNSGDEGTYLFQGQLLAAGRLWAEVPPLGETVIQYRTWIFNGKWIGQYPPGWPMVIAVGLTLGLPAWAVGPLVGGATMATCYALCRRVASPGYAILATLLCAATPFYLFNAASYFSHTFGALLTALLCLFLMPRHEGAPPATWQLLAVGALIGMSVITRYFSIVALTPALLFWLCQQRGADLRRIALWIGLGGLPFLIGLLTYHDLVMGSPLTNTYAVELDSDTRAALSVSVLKHGLHMTVVRFVELQNWTAPSLLLLYGASMLVKLGRRSVQFYDLVFPSLVLSYFVFDNLGGNRYGPRYYFDAFPLIAATIASALAELEKRIGRFVPASAVMALVFCVGLWPLSSQAFHAEVTRRMALFHDIEVAGLHDAVVIEEGRPDSEMDPADLVRNPPFDMERAPVIFARAEARVEDLRRVYPNRTIWHYRNATSTAPSALTPVAE